MAEVAVQRKKLIEVVFMGNPETVSVFIGEVAMPERHETQEALRSVAGDDERELAELEADSARTEEAVQILRVNAASAYKTALELLGETIRGWWGKRSEQSQEEPHLELYPTSASGLLCYLESDVRPWLATLRQKLKRRPLLRDQTLGEALAGNQEVFSRYETHLDRKMAHLLAMLLKLQSLRREVLPSESVSQN